MSGSLPVRVLVLLTVLGVMAGACGDPDVASTVSPTVVGTAVSTSDVETTISTSVVTTSPTAVATQTVLAAFSVSDGECSDVLRFEREVDALLDPREAAFRILVAGPSAEEEAQGAGSIFSGESAETLLSAKLDNGLLVVDFSDFRILIANASTSCGSMALLAQLNTTAFQFEEVERVRYQIEGSCDTFSNWLQRDCMEYTRGGAQPVPKA